MVVIKLQTWNKDEGRKKETHGGNEVTIFYFFKREEKFWKRRRKSIFFRKKKGKIESLREWRIKKRRGFFWRRATKVGIKIFHEVAEFNGKKDMNFLGEGKQEFSDKKWERSDFFLGKRREPKFLSSKWGQSNFIFFQARRWESDFLFTARGTKRNSFQNQQRTDIFHLD